jgi:hypothetical protein
MRGASTARIAEPVDVFKDLHLGQPACLSRMPPDQCSFDGLEERLNGGVESPIFVKP